MNLANPLILHNSFGRSPRVEFHGAVKGGNGGSGRGEPFLKPFKV